MTPPSGQLPRVERIAGMLLVLALHIAIFWGLAAHRIIPTPAASPMLYVELISPTPSALPASRPLPRKPQPLPSSHLPPHPDTTDSAIGEVSAAPAPPTPSAVAVAPTPTPGVPAGPLRIKGELAVSCPTRSAPEYPLISRRRNETGTTLLHVEIDESGAVTAATVLESSGSVRLDDAAISAVKRWRCNPPQRDGQAVRAIARQAFNFVLQGS